VVSLEIIGFVAHHRKATQSATLPRYELVEGELLLTPAPTHRSNSQTPIVSTKRCRGLLDHRR
jgi:hypothetical protein